MGHERLPPGNMHSEFGVHRTFLAGVTAQVPSFHTLVALENRVQTAFGGSFLGATGKRRTYSGPGGPGLSPGKESDTLGPWWR